MNIGFFSLHPFFAANYRNIDIKETGNYEIRNIGTAQCGQEHPF